KGVAPREFVLVSRLPVPVHIRRVLLPHEPRAGVRYRAIPVVDEAPFQGAAGLVEAVLARAGRIVAWDLRTVYVIALRLPRRGERRPFRGRAERQRLLPGTE